MPQIGLLRLVVRGNKTSAARTEDSSDKFKGKGDQHAQTKKDMERLQRDEGELELGKIGA